MVRVPRTVEALLELADLLASKKRQTKANSCKALVALHKALRMEQNFQIYWRLARAYFLMTEQLDNRDHRLKY
ncbi:MAG: hypothetical protein V1754_11900, partial [Pseudomonadota bacterium]